MRRLPRLREIALLFVVSNLTTIAAAQDAPIWQPSRKAVSDQAHRELQSTNPKDVAWGAFRASDYRLEELMPELVAALSAPAPAEGIARFAMISALLDAAIQVQRPISANVLPAFRKEWPVQTAILFANATGDRDQLLLDILMSSSGSEWFAVANLLSRTKPAGFASALLSSLRLNLAVIVSDDGRMGGGGDGGTSGEGGGSKPAGYPPLAYYEFRAVPLPGSVVLSTGPRTVHYTRVVYSRDQFFYPATSPLVTSDADRLAYLTALVSENLNLGLRGQEYAFVAWNGAEDLDRQVSVLKNDLSRRYARLLSALADAKLLTSSEEELWRVPRIAVTFRDLRSDRSQPLLTVR